MATALGCATTATSRPGSAAAPAAPAATPAPVAATPAPAAHPAPVVLVGTYPRSAIVEALPAWGAAIGQASPDARAAAALLDIAPGPRVLVLFGSWCGDSRRELTRLWSAFDLAGGEPRFEIRYVAVDRAKHEPAEMTAGRDLRFVPTFIVERDGHEVGRIVEVSPNGIERDLLDLLSGARSGVISARTDLGP